MTQEDKELLLKDLCARLSYGVICYYNCVTSYDDIVIHKANCNGPLEGIVPMSNGNIGFMVGMDKINALQGDIKPYLRSLSSMTEEEKTELFQLMGNGTDIQRIDFYLSHYFDFRCLIPMGLALEAKEGMYKID